MAKSFGEMLFDALIVGLLAVVGGISAVLIAPSQEAFRVATAQVVVTFLGAFLYQVALERGLRPPSSSNPPP